MRRWLAIALAAGLLTVVLSGCVMEATSAKPVIYLYPEEETRVNVKLDYDGTLTSTYPLYGDGWTVDAAPDGTLTDPATGRQYYCLFWEGVADTAYDFSTGFCVTGADTAAFLEGALADLGLTEKEANEFIIYWLPRMEGNAWNLISFQQEAHIDTAVLTMDPGIHGLEGPERAGGGGAPDPCRTGAHRLYRRGVGWNRGAAINSAKCRTQLRPALSLSKKSGESWAFSFVSGKIGAGGEGDAGTRKNGPQGFSTD